MACSKKDNQLDTETGEDAEMNESVDKPECPVCLQPCCQPVRLPCSHVFCYLCIKGVANQSFTRCAMCRKEFPFDYLDNPNVLSFDEPKSTQEDTPQWYYEGRNGWWQYDQRTNDELEAVYQKGENSCQLLIAGFMYEIDLKEFVQVRMHDRTRKRKIKRDLCAAPSKGIAGIRVPVTPEKMRVESTVQPNSPRDCSTDC